MTVYFNGQFLAKNEVRISPDDRGFLFADSLYEVIRSYRGQLFRADDHLERLRHGVRHLRLSPAGMADLTEVARQLLVNNQLDAGEATVYIQISRGAARRTHAFPAPAVPTTVYAAASPFAENAARDKQHKGIAAITLPDQRWARCDLKTTGLTANVLANQQAGDSGAGEAIFVRDGVLLEGTHTNFMAVLDDVVVTAPLSNYILGGITRKVVLELCRRLDIPVKERPVFATEAHLATEMMVVGTTTEVTPVIRLDARPVGDGNPGPLTRRLQAAFAEEIALLTAAAR
ncbi:MAG: aminotransferase class IV [Desulfopila sp.]